MCKECGCEDQPDQDDNEQLDADREGKQAEDTSTLDLEEQPPAPARG